MTNSVEARTITKGDTRTPYGMILKQDQQPIDLTGLTVAFTMIAENGDSVVDGNTNNVTIQPTFTFTVDATNDWIKHNNTRVEVGDQVVFSSTTTLPAGLTAGTRYFVLEKPSPNCFKVSETVAGPVVNITDAGTGTHSYKIIGSCQYAWASGDVDTDGTFWVWFTVTESSKDDTFPVDGRKRKVVIVEAE